jgi:hypothetical protein
MPKSKANIVSINAHDELVDAKEIGARLGFTADYINRMANAGKVPWVGFKNGARVFRRFNPAAVIEALTHDVEEPVPPEPVRPEVARRQRA